ncbi:hypothetical protein OH76DRAFT_645152 [Lentinus brumalis]|uniref:Uncharacterized protein n=1 Tax=Lentinus brumalis TaxID=2498619 RepID=A0A371D800_9APHY|nr:hypothetical protein OH76DRAFT_645152 [Polyporus brumalis]
MSDTDRVGRHCAAHTDMSTEQLAMHTSSSVRCPLVRQDKDKPENDIASILILSLAYEASSHRRSPGATAYRYLYSVAFVSSSLCEVQTTLSIRGASSDATAIPSASASASASGSASPRTHSTPRTNTSSHSRRPRTVISTYNSMPTEPSACNLKASSTLTPKRALSDPRPSTLEA